MPYAVITGATQGMGKAIAEKLLHEGFSIAICARDKGRLEATEAEWNEKFPASSILAYAADISVKEEINSFGDAVLSLFPEIDILVNNAGIFLMGNIADEPEGQLEQMLAVNLLAGYRLTRKLLPKITTGLGHIFNICSVAGLRANPGSGSYSISKYAVMGFSENLREELRPRRIKVTTICPGSTYNAGWAESHVHPDKILTPTDIASVLWGAYCLSPQANVDNIILRPLENM